MRNRNAKLPEIRRPALAALKDKILESEDRKLKYPLPGQYFLGFGRNMNAGWFDKSATTVVRTLTIFRDMEGRGLKEEFEFVANININIEYPYRIYETDRPVDMIKEVAWIIRFFDLIPPVENRLPSHFLEQKLAPLEFWRGQVYCSTNIPLTYGWDLNWKKRWMSLPLPDRLTLKENSQKAWIPVAQSA